jgi:hypothetical protein
VQNQNFLIRTSYFQRISKPIPHLFPFKFAYISAMRPITLLISFLIFVSACSQNEPGVDIKIPEALNTIWRYQIRKVTPTDTVFVGIVDVVNKQLTNYEGQSNVVIQERETRLDSLQNTPDRITIKFTQFKNDDGIIRHYADSQLDIFDDTFVESTLDTLGANIPSGDDFQRFSAYRPGWTQAFKFKESARFTYPVHPKQRYQLRFRLEENLVFGHVDVETFANFASLDRLRLQFDTSAVTYRMKTTMAMQFELNAIRGGETDTTRLAPFRNSFIMNTWFHPRYGFVKRYREPVRLFIPDLPTRYPVYYQDGEIWDIMVYLPGF